LLSEAIQAISAKYPPGEGLTNEPEDRIKRLKAL
jgi:hypothetical protein